MARDEVDPSLITNDRRKRKLPSYVTNDDNISVDKEGVVKRMKSTINAASCEQRIFTVTSQIYKFIMQSVPSTT